MGLGLSRSPIVTHPLPLSFNTPYIRRSEFLTELPPSSCGGDFEEIDIGYFAVRCIIVHHPLGHWLSRRREIGALKLFGNRAAVTAMKDTPGKKSFVA